MEYFTETYELLKEILAKSRIPESNLKVSGYLRGFFGEIYTAKKLEDLGFKSEEIKSQEPHPVGKNKIDFTIKNNKKKYLCRS